jgi:hypothetical protein
MPKSTKGLFYEVDYSNWFNKTHEEQDKIAKGIKETMECLDIHYITGNQEALPLISVVVLISDVQHKIYGSFLRDKEDRATGKLDGIPPKEHEKYLILIKK